MLPAHASAPKSEPAMAVFAAYLEHLRLRGRGNTAYTQAARSFLRRWPHVQDWADIALHRQLAANSSTRPFVTFLMVTGRLQPGYDYLLARKLSSLWHELTASPLEPDLIRFISTAIELGFTQRIASGIGSQVIARLLIQTDRGLDDITEHDLQDLTSACRRREQRTGRGWKHYRSTMHSARQILFHLGILDSPAAPTTTRVPLDVRMADAPQPLQPSFVAYLRAKSATCTPKTVSSLATRLAHFGRFLAATDPDLRSLADLDRRRHIEPFITSLTTAVNSVTGEQITVADRIRRVHAVGNFLAEIAEWGWDDAPGRRLVFPSDMPRPDRPLPRYLPVDSDRKLAAALSESTYRLAADALLLQRACGLRIGELLDLELDCVHEIPGQGSWLKIPLGKLDTERMVPLHDQVLTVIDRITTTRSPERPMRHPRTGAPADFLFTHHGKRLSQNAVRAELNRAATAAGLGHVTTHQLRHTYATALINAGVSLQALMALLGHYAGDFVKCVVSGGGLIESSEQSVEHFLAAQLSFGGGVVALRLQGGAEFDGGLEEGAGFADGFEVAVQADGSGAVAVAEHPAVHLDTELTHFGAFGVGGQCARLVVEGFDLCADGEVFVGDGAVGDTGVHEGHPHRSVPQQGGQGFESHAAVDRLGRQCVPEAMGRNMADASRFRGFGDCPIDPALADALAVLDEQVAAAQAAGSGGDPGVEEILELGMQGDVAVGAQFPQRHVQPVRCPDLHHGIDCEVEEFTLAQAGAGQELHAQADERVVVGPGGLQQLGERGVVEEAGQRVIAQRQVAGENEHPGRDVIAVPFGEAFKAGTQGAQVLGETGLGQPAAAGRGPGGQVQLVGLDMCPTQVGDADHPGSVGGQPAGELPQHALDAHHRRGPQRQPCLGDVTGEGGRQPWWDRRPLGRPLGRAVRADFAGCTVKDAEVEQRGLRTEQRRAQRLGAVAAGSVASYRRGQRFSLRIDHRLGQPLGSQPGQRGHLDQRRPLQARHDGTEPELGGGRGEPFVELAVMVGGDFAEVGPTRHQIVRAGPQPSRHDQPTDYPSILERQRALRCQRQTRPAVHPHSGEERARHRRHRVSGEHPGRDEVGPVRRDELLDVGAMCR